MPIDINSNSFVGGFIKLALGEDEARNHYLIKSRELFSLFNGFPKNCVLLISKFWKQINFIHPVSKNPMQDFDPNYHEMTMQIIAMVRLYNFFIL